MSEGPEELKYSTVTRITGGDEGSAVDVLEDVDGRKRLSAKAKVADVIDGSGIQGALSVGTSPIEAKAGTSRLTNRRSVVVQPTNGPIWWGWSSNVSTLTGTKIFQWQTVEFAVTDNVPVYLVAEGVGRNVRVSEASWVP